jgi:hypothetical protein
MAGRVICGAMLAAACGMVGGCPMQQGGSEATVQIDGKVVDMVRAEPVAGAELTVVVHTAAADLAGVGTTDGGGRFSILARGGQVEQIGEALTVDVQIERAGYVLREQAVPAHLIGRQGEAWVLPDLGLFPRQ